MDKLGNHIEITNGYAFKSSKYKNSGARIIRITNVQKGIIEDNNPKYYGLNDLIKLDRYKIFENDVLMSLTGNVGRVGKFPKDLLPAYINQRVCRVKSNSDKLDENYLFQILNSNEFEERALHNSSGIAQLNLSTKWIEDFEIPIPPLEIQKRIAQILDDAAALRDKTTQLLKEYDLLAQSIFLEMFGDPVSNPKGWGICLFSDILSKIESGWSPVCENEKRENKSEWAILKLGATSYGFYNQMENKKFSQEIPDAKLNCQVQKDDLLFTRKNTYHMVGATAFVFKTEPNLIIPDTIFKLKYITDMTAPIFLYYLLNHQNYSKEIQRMASGSAASMPNISKAKLMSKSLILPPIDLQNQFSDKIALIEQQKELAKQELKESEDLFNCLLQKAFKGELV